MSINSVNQTSLNEFKSNSSLVTAVQLNTTETLSELTSDYYTSGTANDSINISSPASFQIYSANHNSCINAQHEILNILQAKSSVNFVISLMQHNVSQVLNSIKAPSSTIINILE